MFRFCASNGGSWQWIVGRDHESFRHVSVQWGNAPNAVHNATATDAWWPPPPVYLLIGGR